MATPDYKLNQDGAVASHADLIGWLSEFSQADRYGSRRTQILRELEDRPFRATILFENTERTYGYTSDPRLRGGQTILAALKDSEHRFSVQMPASENDVILASAVGTPFDVTIVITRWHSVDDAYVAYCVFDLDISAESSPPAAAPDADVQVAPDDSSAEETQPVDEYSTSAQEPDMRDAALSESEHAATATPSETDEIPPTPEVPASPEDSARVPTELSQEENEQQAGDSGAVQLTLDMDAIAKAVNPLTSEEVARLIGNLTNLPSKQVDKVLRSFWLLSFDPIRMVDGEFNLTIPLLGSFGLSKKGGDVVIDLEPALPSSVEELDRNTGGPAHSSWIDHYGTTGELPGDQQQFSAQMAVQLAEEHELPIEMAFTIVASYLSILRRVLIEGVREVRIKAVGALKPSSSGYVMKTYEDMKKRLAPLTFWFQGSRPTSDQPAAVGGNAPIDLEQHATSYQPRPFLNPPQAQSTTRLPRAQLDLSGCAKVALILIGTIFVLTKVSSCSLLSVGSWLTNSDTSSAVPDVQQRESELNDVRRPALLAAIRQYHDVNLRIAAVRELVRRNESPSEDLKILKSIAIDDRRGVKNAVQSALMRYGQP